ncbi:hypothetical protein H0H92_004986 [Tricholoma furcatifolium]|nr:hypothetical protein H0H92_004986 [Tricholoma furcatifolium]
MERPSIRRYILRPFCAVIGYLSPTQNYSTQAIPYGSLHSGPRFMGGRTSLRTESRRQRPESSLHAIPTQPHFTDMREDAPVEVDHLLAPPLPEVGLFFEMQQYMQELHTVESLDTVFARCYFQQDNTLAIEMVETATESDALRSSESIQALSLAGGQVTVSAAFNSQSVLFSDINFSKFLDMLEDVTENDLHSRCTTLTIVLPITGDLQPSTDVRYVIPERIDILTWGGNRNQLSVFFTPPSMNHIRELVLNCELDLVDCIRILAAGSNCLVKAEIRTLTSDRSDGILGDVLPTPWVNNPVSMERLTSLSIIAACPIARMFGRLRFPEIRALDLTNSSRGAGTETMQYHLHLLLPKLQRARIHCQMTNIQRDHLNRIAAKKFRIEINDNTPDVALLEA